MRRMPASDAKAKLSEFLDDVERGVVVGITRHGKLVARVVTENDSRKDETRRAMEALVEVRTTMPKLTLDEILALRHEGLGY